MIFSFEEIGTAFCDNCCWFSNLDEIEQHLFVNKYVPRAEGHINRLCFGRLRDAAKDYPEEVKTTIAVIADLMAQADKKGNVVSENTDGYSVTYKDPAGVHLKNEIREVCKDYLGFTGIFQRTIEIN